MISVAEERRRAKLRVDRYRDVAKKTYENAGPVPSRNITIPHLSSVHVTEGGAFVDAVIWIPEDDVC